MDNGYGFMFATGIENSYPTIGVPTHEGRPAGTRIRRDEMEECGHYARMSEDFNLVAELGVRFLRWGLPLHLAWTSDGRYDWSYTDAAMREMDALGIIPIVDLCHFGVPDWLGDFQNPDFPRLFGSYARAFADRFPQVRLYTPVNEMHIAATFRPAWAGGTRCSPRTRPTSPPSSTWSVWRCAGFPFHRLAILCTLPHPHDAHGNEHLGGR